MKTNRIYDYKVVLTNEVSEIEVAKETLKDLTDYLINMDNLGWKLVSVKRIWRRG